MVQIHAKQRTVVLFSKCHEAHHGRISRRNHDPGIIEVVIIPRKMPRMKDVWAAVLCTPAQTKREFILDRLLKETPMEPRFQLTLKERGFTNMGKTSTATAKTNPNELTKELAEKARKLLTYARKQAKKAATWVELSNAIFGLGGKAVTDFPTQKERSALIATNEYKQIMELMQALPSPKTTEGEICPKPEDYSGQLRVRIPRTLHASLALEAKAEGVSLNHLITTKLSTHLAAAARLN